MIVAYLKSYRSYAEAMNKLRFEVRIPEYYDPTIPDYYKHPPREQLPVINGELVNWDEYFERYPDQREQYKSFTPSMIYKAQDLNYTTAMATPSEIIDYAVNNVPVRFKSPEDIEWLVLLMDGYATETSAFAGNHPTLDRYLANMRVARKLLVTERDANLRRERRLHQNGPHPITYDELLQKLSKEEPK